MTVSGRHEVIAASVRGLVVVLAMLVLGLPWLRQVLGWCVLDVVDAILGVQCHRLAGRVIELGGLPMAVCSRCAGVYVGIAGGAASMRPRWSVRRTFGVVVVAAALMLGEIGLEAVGVLPVLHGVRLMTGVALSWPATAFVIRWGYERLGAS